MSCVAVSFETISTLGTDNITWYSTIWRRLLAARAMAIFESSPSASRSISLRGATFAAVIGLHSVRVVDGRYIPGDRSWLICRPDNDALVIQKTLSSMFDG